MVSKMSARTQGLAKRTWHVPSRLWRGSRVNLIALSSPQDCCLLHKVFLTAMVKVVPPSVGLPVGLLPGWMLVSCTITWSNGHLVDMAVTLTPMKIIWLKFLLLSSSLCDPEQIA